MADTASRRDGSATETTPLHTDSSSHTDEGRFLPGAVLGQRYRMISLLGRGGMGEVYRATDLLLGQTVALKFLPPNAARDPGALDRFRSEVRVARQVSHPNVCRVYDIGEAEDLLFLSMEYVDGEDLASLLRRIGHLPHDKALEIVRKLCAGLAAAHDKGVIHRDLKPANIMLDGQGQVRVMDFGLAAFAAEARDVRSGTPAYMSPEQKSGSVVTTRSDIYSLGVVVHEIYTGRRPSEKSTSKAELDPAVSVVIERCLAEDPLKRPASALAVVAALPGGDPLAAALAAGETPSPEMVANAGPVEGMSVRWAAACLGLVLAGLAVSYLTSSRQGLAMIPSAEPPEVLAGRAREYIKSFGYTEPAKDMAMGWEYNEGFLRRLWNDRRTEDRAGVLQTLQPPALTFWYRQHPWGLVSYGGPDVTRTDPWFYPNSVEVVLDPRGQLVEFHAAPAAWKNHAPGSPPDWNKLFAVAGLDIGRLEPAEPQFTPRTAYDVRVAWKGVYPESPGTEVHVEAAAYEGKVSSFRVVAPAYWKVEEKPYSAFLLIYIVIVPLWAAVMVWRNVSRGRADWRGALCLALFCATVEVVRGLLVSHHLAAMEGIVLAKVLRQGGASLCLMGILYLAFEPYVRRRIPGSLVSWSRLLEGRWRDAHVGSDVLIGLAACAVAPAGHFLVALAGGLPAEQPALAVSAVEWSAAVLQHLEVAILIGLGYLLALVMLQILLRKVWLAAAGMAIVLCLAVAPATGVMSVWEGAAFYPVLFFLLARFGLVSATTLIFARRLLTHAPFTTDFAHWYAWQGVCVTLVLVTLGAVAFWTNLGGRRLWAEED
jgi:serine/threonine protein kinase